MTPIPYTDNGVSLQVYLSTPPSANDSNPLPTVVIFPDWDGVNSYEKQRASMIRDELGYVAFAARRTGLEHQEGGSFRKRMTIAVWMWRAK